MKVFKLKQGATKVFEITKENFEKETKLQPPYYMLRGKNNERIQYAICPNCENPIQIIGLYKKLKNTDAPYGKHTLQSIPNLANYNQQAYDNCAYASHAKTEINKNARKEKMTTMEINVYNLLREQFDRIIMFITEQLGIVITNKRAKDMLQVFYEGEGWQYPWATMYNLPWMFAYLSWSQSLFSQPIVNGSFLHKALLTQNKYVKLEKADLYENCSIATNQNGFINLNSCLMHHKRSVTNNELHESIRFFVELQTKENGEEVKIDVLDQTLIIDETSFFDFIAKCDKEGKRNNYFLKLAKSIMPEISEK